MMHKRTMALVLSMSFCTATCKAAPIQASNNQLSNQQLAAVGAEQLIVDQLRNNSQTTLTQITRARKALADIRALHVDISRATLLKVLHEEGGISTANVRRYVIGLGPDKDGRYGLCIKVTAVFVSASNYTLWLRREMVWLKGRPDAVQSTSLYEGFASDAEKPDDVVISLSEPSVGYVALD